MSNPDSPSTEKPTAQAGFVLGVKGEMSQMYDERGRAVPVTLIDVGRSCRVVRQRTVARDGYSALQVGLGAANAKRLKKPMAGVYKKAGVPAARFLREVRADGIADVKPGEFLTVEQFKAGDIVHVVGRTRGRGFAGGVERWGWSSGARTHGSMSHRRIGSVGSGTSPGRVWRGRHLPGHYGDERVTVKNLRVVKVEAETGRLFVSGAVPGHRGTLLVVRKK